MERFIEAVDNDQIRSRHKRLAGMTVVMSQRVWSQRYKADLKVSIRKFYKWLLGNNRTYPPLVDWIDTYETRKEVSALSEAEMERMLDRCTTVTSRALIQVLFDGGFRLGELINIRRST